MSNFCLLNEADKKHNVVKLGYPPLQSWTSVPSRTRPSPEWMVSKEVFSHLNAKAPRNRKGVGFHIESYSYPLKRQVYTRFALCLLRGVITCWVLRYDRKSENPECQWWSPGEPKAGPKWCMSKKRSVSILHERVTNFEPWISYLITQTAICHASFFPTALSKT